MAAVKKTAKKKATATKKKATATKKKKATATKKKKATATKKKATATKKKAVRPAATDDLPSAPTAYRVDFIGRRVQPSVVVGDLAFAGEPGRPPLAEAGKPLLVGYGRSAEDLDTRGAIAAVELGYRVPGQAPRSVLVTTEAAVIDVPAQASGELELWFQLTTADGRVLWDSDFGRNHRVEIVPAGEIWVLFEGERSA